MNRRSAGGLLGFVRRLVPPPVQDSDAALLARFVSDRDEAAFAELVRRHAGLVQAVCRRRLGDSPDADDAAQAVFVALVRSAGRVRESLPGWLYRVAYLTALKAAGRAARRRTEPRAEVAMTDPPDRSAETAELKALLDAELAALPDKYRGVVVLCLCEGRTNTEAAAALGVPVGTVDSRLSTARRKLRDRLVRRGIAGAVAAGFEAALPKAGRAADGLIEAILNTATGTGPVAAGVAELVNGALPMTSMKAKAAAAALIGLSILGGTGAGVLLTAADKPGEQKPAEQKPADPPKVEEIQGTKTTFPNGSFAIELSDGSKVGKPGLLLSAEARKPFDILDRPAGLKGELDDTTVAELLAQLTAAHKLTFRADTDAFKATGNQNVLEKRIDRLTADGLTVREVLTQAFADLEYTALAVRGGQVVVTVSGTINKDVADETNPTVTFVADGKPLAEVAAELRRISGANIVIDGRAMAEAQTPVSGVFNDVRVFTVLTVLADGCDLQPVLMDNVIYVTTRANAARILKPKEEQGLPVGPSVSQRTRNGGA